MARPRVLIADDHKIVVEGLKKMLDPDFDIAGTVEDGRQLVTAAEILRPDVIIVDISMPILNGIDAVRQIKKVHESIKVVFLTMQLDVAYALNAFKAGASGYVLKHSAPDELVTSVHAALEGKTYVTPLIAGKLQQAYEEADLLQTEMPRSPTARQSEVLQLLAEGYSAKEIATILHVSLKTVEYHKYKMMDDLGIKSLAELVRYAVKHGFTAS
jgi:DNA-binding NarL/FixJ family response regulator